jgi:hypothetical protein
MQTIYKIFVFYVLRSTGPYSLIWQAGPFPQGNDTTVSPGRTVFYLLHEKKENPVLFFYRVKVKYNYHQKRTDMWPNRLQLTSMSAKPGH